MMNPLTSIKHLLGTACALVAIFFSVQSAGAQEHAGTASLKPELTAAIELYKQGNDKAAIEALRRVTKRQEREIAAWYYLALCYARQGKTDDARKAYEKAALSGEWLVDAIYASVPYTEVPAKAEQYKGLLLIAAESVQKYLELTPKLSRSRTAEWKERAEMLRDYAVLSEEEKKEDPTLGNKVYNPLDTTTRARIISRPEPGYTDEARSKQITGTVILRCIFAFDGKVRAIRIVKGLGGGLDESAVKAARGIKFIPATVGGKPVSTYIQIEYNFNM